LGWPPAPHWATISCVALSESAATGASDQIYFVWDSSKGKSTGSDHYITCKRYYNLVCAMMRTKLGWPLALHISTISYLAFYCVDVFGIDTFCFEHEVGLSLFDCFVVEGALFFFDFSCCGCNMY
jgi:hypothetical protein